MMFRRLHSQSSLYLVDYCRPVTDMASRQRLQSVNRHLLHVPRYRFNVYGRRTFAVAGLSAWNSFPDYLWASDCSVDSFKHLLKMHLCRGLAVEHWTCDLQVAGSIPGRSAFT